MEDIIIYTDGACLGNPGPGAFCSVLIYKNKRKEISKAFRLTTNNRMELMAIIEALKLIKTNKHKIKIYTDSKYVADAYSKGWLNNWAKNNWKRKSKLIPNYDLWQSFFELIQNKNIEFIWIEGHTGIEENEYCDKTARKLASNPSSHLIDTGYENKEENSNLLF